MLDLTLMRDAAELFGGVTIDESMSTMTIRAVNPKNAEGMLRPIVAKLAVEREQREAVSLGDGLYPPLVIEIVPVERTYGYWNKLTRRVTAGAGNAQGGAQPPPEAERVWLVKTGKRVRSVQVDYGAERLRVGVVRLSEDDIRATSRLFGNDVAVEETGEPAALGRQNDLPPHWAGSQIISGGRCSSGFAMKNASGVKYMLSAGHCGPPGSAWTSAVGESSFGTFHASNTGCLTADPTSVYCYDEAALGGQSYDGRMYIGRQQATVATQCGVWSLPCDVSSSWASVKGTYTPTSDQIVRASGARIGETGGYKVPVNTSLSCKYYGSPNLRWFCGLATLDFVSGAGNYHWDVGDSGGPVFMVISNQYRAVGLISGKGNGQFFYVPISVPLSHFGLSLVTT